MLIARMNIYKYEVYFRQVFSSISGKKFKHGEPFRLVGMQFVPLVVAGDTRELIGAE